MKGGRGSANLYNFDASICQSGVKSKSVEALAENTTKNNFSIRFFRFPLHGLLDLATERCAVQLGLHVCFESIIYTTFLPKSESIIFICSTDPLKLLLKSVIQTRFGQMHRSTDPISPPISEKQSRFSSFYPVKKLCMISFKLTEHEVLWKLFYFVKISSPPLPLLPFKSPNGLLINSETGLTTQLNFSQS